MPAKEHEPQPLIDRLNIHRELIERLEARCEALEKKEADHWRTVENFLSKFGTYHNRTGQTALFIVNGIVNGGGANGIALTPWQGLIEQFALPVKLEKDDKDEAFWTPIIIPDEVAALLDK